MLINVYRHIKKLSNFNVMSCCTKVVKQSLRESFSELIRSLNSEILNLLKYNCNFVITVLIICNQIMLPKGWKTNDKEHTSY